MSDFKFEPMRSLIYCDVAKEDYRPKLHRWLYKVHIPDSISQFEPYVTKYAFYPSFPMPAEGERFGYSRMQLTEHHWLVNDMDARLSVKAIAETFSPEVLVWQGHLPESILEAEHAAHAVADQDGDVGNNARKTAVDGSNPFIFCFLPMWWEEDLKGRGRNIEDGANYRWNVAIGFPKDVSEEEGKRWLEEEMLPVFLNAPECTRILKSAVKKEINDCGMDYVLEMWFENQSAWEKVVLDGTKDMKKPEWAQQEQFPFLKPYHNIRCACVADFTMSNNLQNYHGYIAMR